MNAMGLSDDLLKKKQNLATVKQIAELYPNLFPRKTLYYYLRHREKNGLAACVFKVSRKLLLIDLDKFHNWLKSTNKTE
jgi:hypothetical protein